MNPSRNEGCINSMSDQRIPLYNPVRQHAHSMKKIPGGLKGGMGFLHSLGQAPEASVRKVDL